MGFTAPGHGVTQTCLLLFASDNWLYTQAPENIFRQDIPPVSLCTDWLIRKERVEFAMRVTLCTFAVLTRG